MTATSHMPLVERLRKGANCVVFLDGAPEPAADVADMLRQAADKIELLERREADLLRQVQVINPLARELSGNRR